MENYTSRISVASVVASTVGSMVAAGAVLMSAGLVLANPGDRDTGRVSIGERPTPLPGLRHDLDLPVMRPGAAQDDGFETPNVDARDKGDWRLNLPPGNPRPPVAPPAPNPGPNPEPQGTDPVDQPTAAPQFFGESIPVERSSIIYVIDNSGSMSVNVDSFVDDTGQIVQGTRLDRAKAELRRSISALPDTFKFNVMFFDECAMTCWDSKRDATPENKATAFAWIQNVQPDGWTNTGLGVATALGDKTNTSIVLLSDGAPNFMDCAMNYVGSYDQHRDLILGQNTQGARIDCFGIGVTHDPDARTFMRQVASDSGGSYLEIN